MLMPSPISVRIAGSPAAVAGTLTMRLAPADRLPQAPRLGDRRLRVHGEIGRDLEADVAVAALLVVEDRPQHVGRGLDVADREILVDVADTGIALALERCERLVVVRRCRRSPSRRSTGSR